MKALQVCNRVIDIIEQNQNLKGYIHSVFKNAFNIIIFDEQLISIVSDPKSISPMSILVKRARDFKYLGLTQGMEVTFNNKKIKIPTRNITIDISQSKTWNPSPILSVIPLEESPVTNNLMIVEEYILSKGSLEGIAPVLFNIGDYAEELELYCNENVAHNHYSLFIAEKVVKFLSAFITNDVNNISHVSKEIIGFGPGLTPSVDDFISGLMISLFYLSEYYHLDIEKIIELNKKIIEDIDNRTTRVSIQMLRNASIGEASESVRDLINAIFSEKSKIKLEKYILKVLSFGGTSGSDIICGIYTGCRLMSNKRIRGTFEYEKEAGGTEKHLL